MVYKSIQILYKKLKKKILLKSTITSKVIFYKNFILQRLATF